MSEPPERTASTSLGELAWLFLRLGATAFGGPAAHVAMMKDEVVTRRKWMSEERFLDLYGATNLIPGPNSTELAIHIGWARRRWSGLLVAGLSFIVPAMLITWACAWAYVTYGTLPAVGWLLYGVKPVILAVVVQAIAGLAPKAARTHALRIAGVAILALALFGVDELLLLFATGGAWALAAFVRLRRDTAARPEPPRASQWLPLGLGGIGGIGAAAASSVTLSGIFWVFLKIGAVLFGSGYVLLAFLRADLVDQRGWLTEDQLLDAVAVGQVTPGPVFTTATFIGYLLAGPSGALVATLGIFLPAFVFVALSGPLVPRLRASKVAGAFLDGVNVASLALMAAVTLELGRAALVDVWTVVLAALAAVLLVRFKVGSIRLIALGASLGGLVHLLGLAPAG
jgi:chromate transporter